MSNKKIKIKFHVINSIKGGAGKSTLALMLSNYFIKNNSKSYIMDLDLQGSSWEENYSGFFESQGDNKKYINDLMYDCNIPIENIKREIRATDNSGVPKSIYNIPVYIANPSIDRIDDVQEDLFQNAVYKLIKSIISFYLEDDTKAKDGTKSEDKSVRAASETDVDGVQNTETDDTATEKSDSDTDDSANESSANESSADDVLVVNLILDMPPSKDRYAERVFTNLLLDINSPLYKDISSDFSYSVDLYMMTNVTLSHKQKNITYLKDLVRNRSFSQALVEFIEEDNFRLFFVFNDLSKTITNTDFANFETNAKNLVYKSISAIPFSTEKSKSSYVMVNVMKHMNFSHKNQLFNMIDGRNNTETKELIIDSGEFDNFVEQNFKY